MRSLLCACAALSGCGYGLRGELGPTWIEGQGVGGTAQVSGLLPVIAGSGVADLWVVGGWITATGQATTGGLLFGSDFAILPGGIDQPRSEARDGVGGALRFEPRYGGDGLDFGGGASVLVGGGDTDAHKSWGLGGGKMGVSVDWREMTLASFGGSALVSRNVTDGFDHPGPWRVDLLGLVEWLKVTD